MSNKMCFLCYDIPDRSPAANPSTRLRRIAVRINLSCWVIPESAIPYTLLDTLASQGATWHVVAFDAAEGPKLVVMARAALEREMANAVERCRLSMTAAEATLGDDALAAAALVGERDAELLRYLRRSKAALRRSEKMLRDLEAAAEGFGGGVSAGQALSAVQAIRAGVGQRARAYAAATAAADEAGDRWAADLARRDELPAGILADVIDDRGGDASDLRAAFADLPPAA